MSNLHGNVFAVAGEGSAGFSDGPFAQAKFNRPQGMALDGEYLYVADTENHALRRLDIKSKRVETVAGTGRQSRSPRGGPARETALNSPWDLEVLGDAVYIANAGSHQLWVYRPVVGTVEPFVGTGQEDIIDGPADRCALAQPSGLVSDGISLYFADSEVSALRKVVLSGDAPTVETLIGTGLFDFGDRDGDWSNALLQHPLGVAYSEGMVYVADSYNHKVKAADLATRSISTLAGTGVPGAGNGGAPQFNEPGGLAIAGDSIYVADTNNHLVRVVNVETREVTSLAFDFSTAQARDAPVRFDIIGEPSRIDLGGEPIYLGGEVEITLVFPEGHHLNPLADPSVQFRVTSRGEQEWVGQPFTPDVSGSTITFRVEMPAMPSGEEIEVAVTLYSCRMGDQGLCYVSSVLIRAPLVPGTQTTRLRHLVRTPAP
jgi:DNA-binding beta-propeller fold protein YncE